MATGYCVQCGGAIDGALEGIPLTICCRECCVGPNGGTESHCSRTRFVSKSAVRKMGKNYLGKLDILRFKTKQQNGNVKYSYVCKEVELLSSISKRRLAAERTARAAERRAKEAEKQKRLRQEAVKRKLEVEKLLQVKVEDMDPSLRFFMLKDYLTVTPTIRAEVVRKRCPVYERAKKIKEACMGAHPEAVVEFCIEYPGGGPEEFHELREKMRSVFRLEGARILYRVPEGQRCLLNSTPLADVYEEFQKRDARAITRGHLLKLVGEETADMIMNHPPCQYRLAIGGFETEVAEKLAQFWREKDDVKKRTNRVKDAVEKNGYAMRDDCDFYQQYIQGSIDCEVEEVVAMIAVFEQLQECEMCPHGLRGDVAQEEFRCYFYDQQLDFETSLEFAIVSAMDPDLSDGSCWGSTDTFDFGHVLIYGSEDDDFLDYDDILLDPYAIF